MTAWTNQFETPTPRQLIDGLDPERRELYKAMASRLKERMGGKSTPTWLGARWKWCEVWTSKDQSWVDTIALIPNPDSTQIAMKISSAFFTNHAPTSLPKSLHSGFSNAISIGHQCWCEWPIASAESIETLDSLIEMILEAG
ncbi:MAG: hypothetical protein ACWA5W_05885 [Phycisphaerales bacterium]